MLRDNQIKSLINQNKIGSVRNNATFVSNLKTNNMINEFQIRVILQDYITANPELGIADILN